MSAPAITLPDLDLVDVDKLPPLWKRLVKHIGLAETWRLVEARGGTPLKVGVNPRQAGVLNAILKPESVAILCRELGGQVIDVPKLDKIAIQIRDQGILACDKGASAIAREHGLTKRRVVQIRAGHREEDEGPVTEDMFPSNNQKATYQEIE